MTVLMLTEAEAIASCRELDELGLAYSCQQVPAGWLFIAYH